MAFLIFRMPGSKHANVFLNRFSSDPTQPVGLVISPDKKKLYVADEEGGRLVVLDTSSLKVIRVVPLPHKPHRLAVTPDGRSLFVTSVASGIVDVMDARTYRMITNIPTGINPNWIAITPDGKKAYVSNEGNSFTGSITVIDAATNHAVINTITNVDIPEGMDIARDTGLLYLASQGGWTHHISEVNLPANLAPGALAQIESHTTSVGAFGGDPVFVIDTATDQVLRDQTISNLEVGVTLAVNPDGTKIYVARGNFRWRGPFKWWDLSRKARTPLGVIDTTVIGQPRKMRDIILNTSVSAVAITTDSKYALAGSGDKVFIVDTTTDRVVNQVRLPASAVGIAVGDDDWVYVTVPEKALLFAFSLKGLV
jgi:YVTN family beta-propeller protein